MHGVTSIGEGAFANCTALETVTIPESVTSINECAFGAWDGSYPENVVICGKSGSVAETYANNHGHGFAFVAI